MVDDMKVKFYDEVRRILSNKRSDNNAFLSTEGYKLQIDKLKKTKAMFQEKGSGEGESGDEDNKDEDAIEGNKFQYTRREKLLG